MEPQLIPATFVHIRSTSPRHTREGAGRMPGKMASIGSARTQDAIAGRQLARPPRARCPLPPAASLPLPFSRLLSQTSHVYSPPAQLLRDSPVGRCLSLSTRPPRIRDAQRDRGTRGQVSQLRGTRREAPAPVPRQALALYQPQFLRLESQLELTDSVYLTGGRPSFPPQHH